MIAIQHVCLLRPLISWMSLHPPSVSDSSIYHSLVGPYNILPSLARTLPSSCNRFVYLCMTRWSFICMLLSATCAIYMGYLITSNSMCHPPPTYVPTLMQLGADVMSPVVRPLVIVFSLVIISSHDPQTTGSYFSV